MSGSKTPKGVVGVFVSPKGDVIASVAVFERVSGATSLLNGQHMLAEGRLAYAVTKAYCAPDFANAIGDYDREKIMRDMRGSGFKAVYSPIGHEVEALI